MDRPAWMLGQALTHSARRFRDSACLLAPDGTSRCFGEVDRRVDRLVDSLVRRGVTQGTRVALLATDSFAYVELLLACIRIGATYVPLNYRLTGGEIGNLLARADARMLFVSQSYVCTARAVAGRLPAPPDILSLDGSLDDDHEVLIEQGREGCHEFVVADEDILGIMFTSGTTGLPKGVMQSHRMLKSMLFSGWELMPRHGDVRYTASPLFHIAGQFIVLLQVATGATSLITTQFDPETTAGAIASGTLTGCFLVPTMIASVLDASGDVPGPDERLTDVLYGAAPMPPALLRRALRRWPGVRFWNLFGAGTESGAQTYLRPDDHRRALAGEEHLLTSVGQPLLGVDLRILDDEGVELPRGEVGNIAVRSDVVMSGYLDMPEETKTALRDGWFYGGDRGWLDADDYLFLGGRSRDMIIRGGENIYVSEIELVLAGLEQVSDAAVVGRPDDHWGEVVVAFVEPYGQAPTVEQLDTVCRQRLAAYKVPVEYHVLPALPRNATGKVEKDELKKVLEL